MEKGKRIYILAGPSGAGKTTLGNHLKEAGFPELVSHTTREKRAGEIDGVHYHFVTEEAFSKIEKAEESNYSGAHYCLSLKEVEDKLKGHEAVFAVTDMNGVRQLKEKYPSTVKVIFVTISLKDMEERMRARGDSEENIAKRIENAVANKEHKGAREADYVIANFDLGYSQRMLDKIVKGAI